MVQNRHAGEKMMYWEKTIKELTSFKIYIFFSLSFSGESLALQHGGFVPREWSAAEGRLDSTLYSRAAHESILLSINW